MTRALPPVLAALALLAPASPPAASAQELAGRPFPPSAFAPSPYSSGTKSSLSHAPAPCVGPCGSPTGYGTPEPAAVSAFAVPAVEDYGGARSVHVGVGAAATQTMTLPRGKSAVVDLPTDARDVMVTDPKVADVVLSTPRRIYVTGVSSGQTDATFVDGVGRRILHLDIRVDQDWSAAADTLATLMPGTRIRVHAANNNLILTGDASSAGEADRALKLAGSFVDRPERIVNLITLTGADQVMLKVRIAEVDRTVLKQLGFNLSAVIGQVGGPQYSFGKAITFGVAGALLGGITGGYGYDSTTQPVANPVVCPTPSTCVTQPQQVIDRNYKLSGTESGRIGTRGVNQASSMVEAFERAGLVRTLAEPNLTAISGESGRFLVGGEFPVPVSQGLTGVSVEFKPYGVGLGYTPVVLSDGRISLKISAEVSDLTSVGAFNLTTPASTTGSTSASPAATLTIPGLSVRRAETTVELPSGGSMMVAGLLQSQTKETLDSLPGLMQVPVVGALLRSRDFQNNETELVIIVTPYLVKPGRPEDFATPADGLKIANDIETNLLGRLNTGFGKPAAATAGKTYQGPFGYVVD